MRKCLSKSSFLLICFTKGNVSFCLAYLARVDSSIISVNRLSIFIPSVA